MAPPPLRNGGPFDVEEMEGETETPFDHKGAVAFRNTVLSNPKSKEFREVTVSPLGKD